MRKATALMGMLGMIGILASCGEYLRREIISQRQSTRNDVFLEVDAEGPIPAGYALIQVRASLKTRPEHYYWLDWGTSEVGKPGYPVILNIDGQAIEWKIDGTQENTPRWEKGQTSPEGGEGVRFVLKKTIRLRCGPHRVFVGLPRDQVMQEFDLLVAEGGSLLEFKPVYKAETMVDVRRQESMEESFVNGIRRLETYYNGQIVKPLPDRVFWRMMGK